MCTALIDLKNGDHICVIAHSRIHPSDVDWNDYIDHCKIWLKQYKVTKSMVFSEGGNPSFFQLLKLASSLPIRKAKKIKAVYFNPNESAFAEFTVNNLNRALKWRGMTHFNDQVEALHFIDLEPSAELLEAINYPLKDLKGHKN